MWRTKELTGSCTLLVQDINASDLVLILVVLVHKYPMCEPSGIISGPLHLHQCPYPYPHPQGGVTLSQKSYVAPSKAAQAPMVQIKPHHCEDLNDLTGKAKPHQTLVKSRAYLEEMSPRQRQHCLACYV